MIIINRNYNDDNNTVLSVKKMQKLYIQTLFIVSLCGMPKFMKNAIELHCIKDLF